MSTDPSVPSFDDAHPILVFDGICVLCSASLQFVLRHDRREDFRFVVAQSPLGQALYRHYGLDPERLDTVLVIEDGRLHTRLGAFAVVMRHLPWPWRILSLSRFLRWPLGDRAYDLIARNRYRWFGRKDQCMLPSKELRRRFLEGGWIAAPGARLEAPAPVLYERVLGAEAWQILPGPLRRLHDVHDRLAFTGEARILTGTHPLARFLRVCMRFPPASECVPVRVVIERRGETERWTRQFGQHRFASNMSAAPGRPGCVVERFGALRFRARLPVDESGLSMPLEAASAFGIPLPVWLVPRSQTRESVDEQGRFCFDVDVSMALLGRVIRYTGWLVPETSEAVPAV